MQPTKAGIPNSMEHQAPGRSDHGVFPESVAEQGTVDSLPAAVSLPPVREDPAQALVNHPRYQLLRKLGEGGMGAVFLAEHRLMHRPVALKLIRTACLAHPEAVARFRREIQAAACLSHPNIVTAYDAEETGDGEQKTHFLVMEYAEGVPLNEWLAQHGRLPVAEACHYVYQAALGLQYAHTKGMVHRDLKPHNLMRTPDGTVKILDFGLARFVCEADTPPEGHLTAEGAVMGTPDYMAPEQAQDGRQADIRADIYSLGCTLYELLAERVPFPNGTVIDKLINHAMTQPEPLNVLYPTLPAGLADVVARMMAKKPAERYQTPAEVAAALAPFSGGSAPVLAPNLPTWRRLWKIAAAAFLVFVAAALVILVKTDRGTVTIQVEDADIEVVARKNGDVVLFRDTKTGKEWNLDTKNLNLGRADEKDGLRIDLDERTPLVLRRQGARLLTITSPPARVTEKPGEKVKPEDPGKPQLLAVGLSAGKVLIDDDFKDANKSEFEPGKGKGRNPSRWEFAEGSFVMDLRGGPTYRVVTGSDRLHGDFICQVTGRTSARTDGSWGIDLDADSAKGLFMVMVRGDGQIEVIPDDETQEFSTPKLKPFPSSEGFRPGDFNTLVVARQGQTVSIFLNSKPITKPFTLKQPLGRCKCFVRGEQHGKLEVRVEFRRYTIWEILPEN